MQTANCTSSSSASWRDVALCRSTHVLASALGSAAGRARAIVLLSDETSPARRGRTRIDPLSIHLSMTDRVLCCASRAAYVWKRSLPRESLLGCKLVTEWDQLREGNFSHRPIHRASSLVACRQARQTPAACECKKLETYQRGDAWK
jgi:hypothetical protein